MSPSSARSRRPAPPPAPAGAEELVDALRATLEPIAQAVGAELVPLEALDEGDIPVAWAGRTLLGFRLPGLHGALERLLQAVEREEGVPLRDLPREAKQRVVERLDKAGAFTVRRAAEEVADALGVSRFTVYNYLNAIRDQAGGPSA
ncbi:helix-turn-helix domain-containing protein [Aciditerrimonas ferrireducens]|uniref:Helix-turn-helix domain-containing protein n=1 Tax=Aciditerrimonas ferrireducens TaxID=667306 RepID=A0ABV6BZW5_9ACTN